MKIYNWRVGNIWVDLACITANLAKVQVEEVFVSQEDLKTKEWKARALNGKTPMLETPEGNLVESAAIARYLASQGEGHLGGANAWETAQVNQWVDYSHTTIFPHLYPILRAVFGLGDAVDSDAYNNAVKEIKEIVKILNTHLQGKTHLVSNRITVADVAVAVQLIPLYQTILDAGFRKAMPNTAAWLESLIKLPEVVRRVGNVKFAAKAVKATHVLEKKKEEPKAAAPKPAKAAAADDGEEAAAPKKGNPLDNLPPSKFVLPDFKTYFVNLGDKKATEGMDHFFQNYDPEGYSIYFVHYDKYEGEGVVLYQTSNLMNGFLQRMDEKFRNYTFSLMAILGEEPNLEIQGVWLFRGKGIPQEMIDHPQFEYYQRRELDVTKEADRKLISEFWAAKVDGTTNGLKVQEIKMFK
jgi:elongation factor 1-gamma